ncbi:hypothetical protein AVEN_79795-1 [Araneus ventricosus]|uniref:ATP-dependent DNA helicase n=1 Tax=Araneus ventricosus TaxID=182803 RepID=A0A4Y2G221_ARAVE|nr:hypothetical protein AVEN_79795-1 [Araneus ventricosus]
MSHKAAFEALVATLKDIRHNNKTMGGITEELAGDFRQTLPVISRGTRADEMQACLKSSCLWNAIQRHGLTKDIVSEHIGSTWSTFTYTGAKDCGTIILLRNLHPPSIFTGTRLCIKKLIPNIIEAKILTGHAAGENVFIPRIPIIPSDFPHRKIKKRRQFPVRLNFVVSIKTAQG